MLTPDELKVRERVVLAAIGAGWPMETVEARAPGLVDYVLGRTPPPTTPVVPPSKDDVETVFDVLGVLTERLTGCRVSVTPRGAKPGEYYGNHPHTGRVKLTPAEG